MIPPRTRAAPWLAAGGLLLATLLVSTCGGGARTPFAGDRAFSHVEKMVGFGPRPAGSEAMKRQADWLQGELEALGIEAEQQVFRRTSKEHGYDIEFRNVVAKLPGTAPEKTKPILLCAHYDTKLAHGHDDDAHNFAFVGAIDGAGASACLLELARVLKARNDALRADPERPGYPLPPLWFVWFDGEENLEWDWNKENDHKALFGSRHFVSELAKADRIDDIGAMILLDLIGDKDIKIDRDTASNVKLQDMFEAGAEKIGQADKMYRYKSSFTDDHLPFRDAGIPAVLLIDFQWRIPGAAEVEGAPPEAKDYQAWWHTPEDTIDKMSPEALQFVGDLVYTTLPEIERTYGQRGR